MLDESRCHALSKELWDSEDWTEVPDESVLHTLTQDIPVISVSQMAFPAFIKVAKESIPSPNVYALPRRALLAHTCLARVRSYSLPPCTGALPHRSTHQLVSLRMPSLEILHFSSVRG